MREGISTEECFFPLTAADSQSATLGRSVETTARWRLSPFLGRQILGAFFISVFLDAEDNSRIENWQRRWTVRAEIAFGGSFTSKAPG